MLQGLFIAALALLLSACSSLSSTAMPTGSDVTGVTYFMPRKDFVVVVKVADKGKRVADVTLGASAAYADTSTQYVMNYHPSLVSLNKLDVQVADSGLLSTAKSSSESRISDAFKSAAASAGAAKGLGLFSFVPEKEAAKSSLSECAVDGDHSFAFAVEPKENKWNRTACGVTITFERLNAGSRPAGHSQPTGQGIAGIFYRLDEPFLVSAHGQGINKVSVVHSPSGSPTYFLPIARSLFAKNEAELTITDGILRKYRQESDGELVALLKIPADVLSAYFSALGSTLDAFKATDAKEAAALAEAIKLELAKKKFDACLAAIQAGDETAIKTLKCAE
ncbi:MAG: hypothetical protein KIS74_05635 [Burkholderiales bacterium]|nr:hypothetical protein [Burkholderiales bacterium]